ncbi:lytic polysaccharide monooxygenase AA11 family protein, partial [Aspergillus fijiensis CBS 313.89]
MFSKSTFVAVTLLGLSAVEGHMIMSKPVPYGKDTLNNSPLAADGSDFPCKLRSNTYQVTEWNKAAVGESMPLTFQGSAVHGGGSCQISLTTDLEPTKDSSWMVIKSFEGGCPANVDGNLPANPNGVDPYSFNYTIPEGITPGKYTLAWTWFNRIGNREMYMNCAPLEVTGGSSSKRSRVMPKLEERSSSFPPMFVANVNGCTTKEGVDIRFPQPGADVQYLGEASNLAPEGSAACTGTATFGGAGDTSSGTSSGTSSSSGSGSGAASSAAAAVSSAVVANANANTGSYSASTTTAAANTAYAAPPAASSASSGSASGSSAGSSSGTSSGASSGASPQASAGSGSSGSGSTSTSTSGALSGSCSTEGQWNCINGSSFQRCANGKWTASQAMASGTQCTPGQSADLSIATAKSKRDVTEMRARRRAHGGH